jgi:hypothetical protein
MLAQGILEYLEGLRTMGDRDKDMEMDSDDDSLEEVTSGCEDEDDSDLADEKDDNEIKPEVEKTKRSAAGTKCAPIGEKKVFRVPK